MLATSLNGTLEIPGIVAENKRIRMSELSPLGAKRFLRTGKKDPWDSS
jgi:hypothetical protein